MQKFTVRKFNASKNKEIITTIIASNEENALVEAAIMRNPTGYIFEIIRTKNVKPASKLQDLRNRKPGVIPAYGDFEATGWMDK